MANKTEYNAAETAYFTAYQKHIKTMTPARARAAATRDSGSTPKDSWVGKLKGGVKREMARENKRTREIEGELKKTGMMQRDIDRLKGK